MNHLEALISLNKVGDIGTIRLKKLLEIFGQPEKILQASTNKLTAVAGIGEEIAARIRSFKKEDLDRELNQAKKLALKILTFEDKDYPQNLKYIPDPPIVLYLKGELKREDNLSIAIVGSRRASHYGLSNAEKFAADLAERGYTIISGMARGVDSCAHRGALKQGGRTIAVIGSGFNQIYPPENKELAEEITRTGVVISEFSLDTPPFKQNFPRRNRVISGLSLGVLVAEAARNSGALITADFALEQGREVFCLPGRVDSSTSFGSNALIKQGAKLVSCVDDILEEFNFILNADSRKSNADSRRDDNLRLSARNLRESALNNEELSLYNIISEEPSNLDELKEKTNLDISGISDILLKLQLKKLIKQLPGKQFVRN